MSKNWKRKKKKNKQHREYIIVSRVIIVSSFRKWFVIIILFFKWKPCAVLASKVCAAVLSVLCAQRTKKQIKCVNRLDPSAANDVNWLMDAMASGAANNAIIYYYHPHMLSMLSMNELKRISFEAQHALHVPGNSVIYKHFLFSFCLRLDYQIQYENAAEFCFWILSTTRAMAVMTVGSSRNVQSQSWKRRERPALKWWAWACSFVHIYTVHFPSSERRQFDVKRSVACKLTAVLNAKNAHEPTEKIVRTRAYALLFWWQTMRKKEKMILVKLKLNNGRGIGDNNTFSIIRNLSHVLQIAAAAVCGSFRRTRRLYLNYSNAIHNQRHGEHKVYQ